MPKARSLAAPAGCRIGLAGRKKRRIAVAGAAIAAVLAGSLTAGVPRSLTSCSPAISPARRTCRAGSDRLVCDCVTLDP
jgi:hypothetical protein